VVQWWQQRWWGRSRWGNLIISPNYGGAGSEIGGAGSNFPNIHSGLLVCFCLGFGPSSF